MFSKGATKCRKGVGELLMTGSEGFGSISNSAKPMGCVLGVHFEFQCFRLENFEAHL